MYVISLQSTITCLNIVEPEMSGGSPECRQHFQTVFFSDPLPGVGVAVGDDILVEPEKTADYKYVSL